MAGLRINANDGLINVKENQNNQAGIDKKVDDLGKVKDGRIKSGGFKNNLSMSEQVKKKRDDARRQALKLIGDAWEKDKKATEGLNSLEKMKTDKMAEYADYQSKLKDVNNQKDSFMEKYGVDKDSQEQKDLELLEKYQDRVNGVQYSPFTEDEVERLKELQYMDRTEYQKECLRLNGAAGEYKKGMDLIDRQMKAITQAYTDTKSEMEKSKDMVDAQNASDQIIQAAEDDVYGMLIQEGKDNIDEKVEEEKEKREKMEEEKLDKEEKLVKKKEQKAQNLERLEKQRDDRKIIEGQSNSNKVDMSASLNKSTSHVEKAQKTIQVMVEKAQLIEDDLKGIKIDFNF